MVNDTDRLDLEAEDPFELFGLPADANERCLKRAYVAAIKRYRPESHPTQFMRIRAAYEAARDGYWLGPPTSDLGAASDDDPPTSHDAETTPPASCPQPRPSTSSAQQPEPPSWSVVAGPSSSSARPMWPAATVAPEAPAWREIDAPGATPAARAQARRQRLEAVEALAQLLDKAVEADDTNSIRLLLSDPSLDGLPLEDARLQGAILRSLALLAWEDSALAVALHLRTGLADQARRASATIAAQTYDAAYTRALLLSEAWSERVADCPPALGRWLRSWMLLERSAALVLLRSLADESRSDPARLLAAVDELESDPGLTEHLCESLRPWQRGERGHRRGYQLRDPWLLSLVGHQERRGDQDDAATADLASEQKPTSMALRWAGIIVAAGAFRTAISSHDASAGFAWAIFITLVVFQLFGLFSSDRRSEALLDWERTRQRARIVFARELLTHRLTRIQLWREISRLIDGREELQSRFESLRHDPALWVVGVIAGVRPARRSGPRSRPV